MVSTKIKGKGTKKLTIVVKLIRTAHIQPAATALGGGNSPHVLFDMFPPMLTASAY